jgi:hypothetical protein
MRPFSLLIIGLTSTSDIRRDYETVPVSLI